MRTNEILAYLIGWTVLWGLFAGKLGFDLGDADASALLSERHCVAITDRHAFEQCKRDFLTETGDKK